MSSYRLLLVPLAFVLATATLAQPSAEPAGEREEAFSETFDVRVINLEAVVEDKNGNRVEGLGIGDFEILVDGKSQPVEYFTEIRNRSAATPAAPDTAAAAPAAAVPRPPGLAENGRLATSYVVFIDLATGDPRRAYLAGEKLAEQIGQIPPEDRIAVFVFDGRQLENIADWRDSRERVLASLHGLERWRTFSAARAQRRANDLFTERDSDLAEGSALQEDLARRSGFELAATFAALATVMRSAAPPPGRRVLLAFAGAWPRDMAAFLGIPQNAAENAANKARVFYPTEAYSAVYETANRLGYTIYASDLTAGVRAPGSAENGSVERAGSATGRDFDRDFESDATLLRYAEQTGGKAFTSGFGDTGLAQVQDDLASFYWLGFTAKREAKDAKDKSHKVEVRVKRPGLEVRSRKQYKDLSRKSEIDQEIESRLLFLDTRFKQDFTVLPGEPTTKRNEIVLPITLRIPLDLVAFLPKGGGYRADLELRVATLGRDGERSPEPKIPVVFEGPQPRPGQFATYETQLRLRKESRRFVLGLYDKQGDRLLVSTVDLDQQ